MKTFFNLLILATALLLPTFSYAQIPEPDFVGEVYLQKGDTYVKLEKEIGAYTKGISWKSNSWNALSLEVEGKSAQIRINHDEQKDFVVRAVDNNTDPISIITVYKFDVKRKKRKTILSLDNSGTLMKSRTITKNQVKFDGKKYGSSSYLISFNKMPIGEYGITVANPNNVDEKRTIVSCFGVD